MSALGVPSTDGKSPQVPESPTIHEALAALPRPRKHYQWWYSTPARQSRDVVLQARRPRFSTRLLPPQERRLERQQAAQARRLDSGRTCQDADLLCDGSRRRHADRRRQGNAVGCRDHGLSMAARRTSSRCMPANTGATGFRAGSTGIARAPAACSKPSCSFIRQDHRRAVDLHLGQQRLGRLPAPRRGRKDERHRLHADDRRPPTGRGRALGATGAT